jgi:hypothetical protein
MQPNDMPIGDGLFYLRTVAPKSLSKAGDPISSPPHLYEVKRGREDKEQAEKDIVKEPHSDGMFGQLRQEIDLSSKRFFRNRLSTRA